MHCRSNLFSILLLGFSLAWLPRLDLQAAGPERHVLETSKLKLVVVSRTPQQIAAFYEGRGFPRRAIELTRTACFFTIGLHNKTQDILWLETANWQFHTETGPLRRITREEWKQHWQQLELAMPYQSTFRWTLLPAKLDFQADEREGGNITLSRTDKPFSLHATFATGKDKQGPRIDVQMKDLRCAEDKP